MEQVDVVISGIGGYFPRSQNICEFSDNLLAGKSLLEPIGRWKPGWEGTPKLAGQVQWPERFDNTFFGMHSKVATQADPLSRIALENAFEALVDAGVSPSQIRGSNAHVYSATFHYEADAHFCFFLNSNGYSIMGRNRCMMSNRISYWLNLTGRSCSYEANYGWVGAGLAMARKAIQSGECETAIVLGSSLMLQRGHCKQRADLGLLSLDSSSCPFDAAVDGYGRAEAQVCFLLQRADLAKRSYGTIVAVGAETSGPLPNWLLSVNEEHLHQFVTSLYQENGVDPTQVKLLEADGLCNKEMVEAELKVLDRILNCNRAKIDPLFIGSVRSIVGDSEGAAGHVALTKVLLALDTGVISPTLSCGKLNPNISGLTEGRYKVITDATKWEVTPDTHVAVNCLSTSGVIAHVAIKANGKEKKTGIKNEYHLPYLLFISGRTEDVVGKSFQKVSSSPFDPEYLRLTQEFFAPMIDKYQWRGYGYHGSESVTVQRENRRPVWFVYSGMGSQWSAMGKDLVRIPIMKETFERLQKYLQPKRVNLMQILTSTDHQIFDNILHSFIGITAIQIAFTNLLRELGIKPDGMIGHSVGELGCSYADGCLTEEETILTSHARGEASLKADLEPGLMAAVGLGYKEVKSMLPPEVVVACHNSNESATLSGPKQAMNNTIQYLEKKNIFVRSVNVSNIAYHSPFIQPAAPYLLNSLRQIITQPKLRSSKWICTSVPREKWDSDEVRYCSAEYHTNNLLNPVYFEEGSAAIPKNALVIEIAPHGLLQAILKRSLGSDVVNINLAKRGASNAGKVLLDALGKLFLEGVSPEIWRLYPAVSFPVSRNTPSLTPLIAWEHEDEFDFLSPFRDNYLNVSEELKNSSPSVEIAGVKALLPTFPLAHIWTNFVRSRSEELHDSPVVFKDVSFYDLIELKTDEKVEINLSVLPNRGDFVTHINDKTMIRGKIRSLDQADYKLPNLSAVTDDIKFSLSTEDIYAEMKSRNVCLPDSAKCLKSVNIHSNDWLADVDFNGDWAEVLHSLLILFQLLDHEEDQTPTYVRHIQRLVIDPAGKDLNAGKARLHLPSSTLTYRGVELHRVSFRAVEKPVVRPEPFPLRFVPYGLTELENEHQFLLHVVHLSLEKRVVPIPIFKIHDVDGTHSGLAIKLQNILTTGWSLNCETINEPRDATLILCGAASISAVAPIVADEGNLLLSRCVQAQRGFFDETLSACCLLPLAESQVDDMATSLVVVSSQLPSFSPADYKIIKMDVEDNVPTTLADLSRRLIILVWEKGCRQPIEKLYHELTTMQCAEKVRLVILLRPDGPPFSLSVPLYADQMRRNVPINVYVDGQWGGYRFTDFPDQHPQSLAQNYAIKSDPTANGNGPIRLNYVGLSGQRRSTTDISSVMYEGLLDYSGEFESKLRVMGLAYYDKVSGLFKRDPHLVWTLPDGWSLEEAATVPSAYATMYYNLLEVARLRAKQSVLITSPLTHVGQAAVHIASSMDCVVFMLAESSYELEFLQRLYPKLPSSRILLSSSDSFACQIKKIHSQGVQLVVSDLTGNRLKASVLCLSSFSRLLQIGVDSMLTSDSIGMNIFLKAVTVYGATEKTLLSASVETKRKVAAWVQKGLDDNVVRPNRTRRKYSSNQIVEAVRAPENGDFNKRIICLQEEKNDVKLRRFTIPINDPGKCTIVIGGSKSQWIRMVHWLARRGSKHINVLPEPPSPGLVARHAQIVQQNFQTQLTELRTKSGAHLVDHFVETCGIQAIFVFSQNKFSEDVVAQLLKRGLKNTPVVSLSQDSNNFSRMCERWAKAGLKVRAALGVEDVPTDTATPILDWLLSMAAPPVSVLSGPKLFFRRIQVTLGDARLLPASVAELRVLGAGLRTRTQPAFRELSTQCTIARHTREIQPLFFIKGIHGTAKQELDTLATNLLCPLFEVTLHANCHTLEATAQALVKGIQEIQPRGPYNLAGDSIRSAVVMKAACVLEEKGHASVVFLLDEGISAIREELLILQKGNKIDLLLLKLNLFEDVGLQGWKSVDWDKLSWREQVSTAVEMASVDTESRHDVIAALDHVRNSVSHIIQAEEGMILHHGIRRSFKKGEEYQENAVEERHFDHVVSASKLQNKDVADVIGANLATPALQLDLARALNRQQSQLLQ